VEEAEKRIGFEYQVFAIAPTRDEENAKRLSQKVEGLGDDLMSEIVKEANTFYTERLAGCEQCAVSTKQTLKNIRDKDDGLSFLNSAFAPLVKLLDQTLDIYVQHAEGRNIRAPYFYQIVAATLIMCERKRIENYSYGILSVDDMAQSCRNERAEQTASTGEGSREATALPDDDIDAFFDSFDDSAAEAIPEAEEAKAAFITTTEDDLYF
jgi:hypothetical protein